MFPHRTAAGHTADGAVRDTRAREERGHGIRARGRVGREFADRRQDDADRPSHAERRLLQDRRRSQGGRGDVDRVRGEPRPMPEARAERARHGVPFRPERGAGPRGCLLRPDGRGEQHGQVAGRGRQVE